MSWEEIWSKITVWCVDIAWKLLWAAVALAVGTLVIKLIIRYFPKGSKKRPMDTTVRSFLISATKLVLYIMVAVIVIGILGVPLASVIAVLASAGAAIALALQGSLANIASGIMLLIFKPLKIGDYIETDGVSGTVDDVGLFYTTLKTPDHKRIEMPNSKLTSNSLTNYSSEKHRRVDLTFQVAFDTDTEYAKELIMKAVLAHKKVLRDPPPTVRMTALDSSSLTLNIRVWVENPDFWDVKFDLTEQIKKLLDDNGIVIPYQQLDVHVK